MYSENNNTITLRPSLPQFAMLTARQSVNLFLGGQGSGKSHCAGILSAMHVSSFPHQRGLICANTYGQLTKSTLYRIREVWKSFGIVEYSKSTPCGSYVINRRPPKHFDTSQHNYDNYKNIISFANGAVIYTGSTDNYRALDGIEATWAILDETKDTPEMAVKQVILGRLRQTGLYITEANKLVSDYMRLDDGSYGSPENPEMTPFNPLTAHRSLSPLSSSGPLTAHRSLSPLSPSSPLTAHRSLSPLSPSSPLTAHRSLSSLSPFNPLYIFTSPANVPWLNEWFHLYDHEREINERIFSATTFFQRTIGNKYVVISSTYHNAANLPGNFIQSQEENLSSSLRDMLIYGCPFARTGGAFYRHFDRARHVGACAYNPAEALHISFDENVHPYLPLGIFQFSGKRLCMIDEIAATDPNNNVDWLCAEFTRRYNNHNAGLFIYGDATSRHDDAKQQKGYDFFRLLETKLSRYRPQRRVARSNPSVVMRGNFINSVLEKELEGCSFLIDHHCTKTIADFALTLQAADGTKNKRTVTDPATKITYQPHGHFTDLTDYIMCYVWTNEYYHYQHGDKLPSLLYTPPRNARI